MIPWHTPASTMGRTASESSDETIANLGSWNEMQGQEGNGRPVYEWIERLAALNSAAGLWRPEPVWGGVCLDLLPLIVPPRDWVRLERGLRQRAKLLDLILKDAYGPQETIQAGWLPAGVVYACPRFLRSAHRGTVAEGSRLRFHTADLIQTSKGTWQVVADRVGLPGGLGLALMGLVESDDALGGVPDVPGSQTVKRFPAALRGAWEGTVGRALRVPQGKHGDADLGWLVQALSWAVVDDADLVFRGDQLHRMTPSGFERIELLVEARGWDDDGSVESARGWNPGQIVLPGHIHPGTLQRINPPGSELVENPAWIPFLPRLCQLLLDEDLMLPSVPTWWCGERQSLRQVEDHLGRLEVESVVASRPGFLRPRVPIGFADEVRIRRRLNLRPECWVAREPLEPSEVPWTSPDGVVGRPTVLRMFTVETPSGWQVLPGGLAYTPDSKAASEAPLSSTPPIKTVWVDPGPSHHRPTPSECQTRIHRSDPDPILSLGMAERLVCLGQTWARCDHGCRCIGAILERSGDGIAAARDPLDRVLSTHLLSHLGFHCGKPSGKREAGTRPQETDSATRVPQGWLHSLCDAFLEQVGPCQPHLPLGVRGLVERLRCHLHRILKTPGQNGIEDLPFLLEALRGCLLDGFEEGVAGRFMALGWHWEQPLHAGTLLLDLLPAHPHRLPGVATAMDSILGTGRSWGHRSLLISRNCRGVLDTVWHPKAPGSLLRRVCQIRDALDQVQGHSPGLFLNRSRQGVTESVIEAERAGTGSIGSPAGTEEAIRRIVTLVRRAREDFSEAFNDLLR